jgi:hypothetical protein
VTANTSAAELRRGWSEEREKHEKEVESCHVYDKTGWVKNGRKGRDFQQNVMLFRRESYKMRGIRSKSMNMF